MDQHNRATVRAGFISLTSNAGWGFFREFAEKVIVEMERQAIDELDDVKANGLRRDARGARRFWGMLLQSMEFAKTPDIQPSPEQYDQFYAIVENYLKDETNERTEAN